MVGYSEKNCLRVCTIKLNSSAAAKRLEKQEETMKFIENLVKEQQVWRQSDFERQKDESIKTYSESIQNRSNQLKQKKHELVVGLPLLAPILQSLMKLFAFLLFGEFASSQFLFGPDWHVKVRKRRFLEMVYQYSSRRGRWNECTRQCT